MKWEGGENGGRENLGWKFPAHTNLITACAVCVCSRSAHAWEIHFNITGKKQQQQIKNDKYKNEWKTKIKTELLPLSFVENIISHWKCVVVGLFSTVVSSLFCQPHCCCCCFFVCFFFFGEMLTGPFERRERERKVKNQMLKYNFNEFTFRITEHEAENKTKENISRRWMKSSLRKMEYQAYILLQYVCVRSPLRKMQCGDRLN